VRWPSPLTPVLAAALALASPPPPRLQPASPSAVEAALERGASHLQRNETAQAIGEIKRALALDPRSGRAHQLLAEAYLQDGSYEMLSEARAELLQAVALDPNLVWARFYLARLYLDVGAADKAREQLTAAVALRSDLPHLHSLLGEAERQLGNPGRSIEHQRRALGLDAAFAPARYYLGLAHLDLGQPALGLKALEVAASSGLPVPDLYLTLGALHQQAGGLDRARSLFERAVQLAPRRPDGHLRLARVHRLQRRPERALDELARVLPAGERVLPTQYYQRLEADVEYERGRAMEDLELWDEARRAFSRAIDVTPDYGEAHHHLAAILYRQGDFGRALAHAERAAALQHPLPPELVRQITARARKRG
jgi:tetratricopeptide (TPR) repeat protein